MNFRKNTIQLTIANFIQLLFNVVQTALLSRFISGKTDFGKFQQVLLIAGLLVAAVSALPNAINYFFGLYQLETVNAGKLIRRFSFVTLLASIVFALLLLLFRAPMSRAFNNDLFELQAKMVTALVFLRLFNVIYQNVCLIRQRLSQLMFVNLVQSALLLFLFFFRDANGNISITMIFQVLIATEALKTLAILVLVSPFFTGSFFHSRDLNLSSREWRYIGYLFLNSLLVALTAQVDRLIVSSNATPEIYSDYSLGSFANPVIGVILASIATTFVPVLSGFYARKDFAAILATWKKIAAQGAVMVLPLVFFTILFGKEMIIFLFSRKYVAAGLLFQVYNCKYIFIFLVFSVTMNAIGLEKYTLVNSVINVLVTALFVFVGVRLAGSFGAVLGSVLSLYAGYLYPIFIINRKLHCSVSDYFPVRIFLLATLVCGITGLVFVGLKLLVQAPVNLVVLFGAPAYCLVVLFIVNRYVLQVVDLALIRKKIFSS